MHKYTHVYVDKFVYVYHVLIQTNSTTDRAHARAVQEHGGGGGLGAPDGAARRGAGARRQAVCFWDVLWVCGWVDGAWDGLDLIDVSRCDVLWVWVGVWGGSDVNYVIDPLFTIPTRTQVRLEALPGGAAAQGGVQGRRPRAQLDRHWGASF